MLLMEGSAKPRIPPYFNVVGKSYDLNAFKSFGKVPLRDTYNKAEKHGNGPEYKHTYQVDADKSIALCGSFKFLALLFIHKSSPALLFLSDLLHRSLLGIL